MVPTVTAHGYVMRVISANTSYDGNDPKWIIESPKPQRAGWYAKNQDLGFIPPSEYNNPDKITCHEGATPGTEYIPVTAGESIDIQWQGRNHTRYRIWNTFHKGPVISALARCDGDDCTKASPDKLNFFVIHAEGMFKPPNTPQSFGFWAADKMRLNNNTLSLTIPQVPSGNYVLRHEIITLQGPIKQNYPNCLNLKITGSSSTQDPCSNGAVCKLATDFYKPTDPGIDVSIHRRIFGDYIIPGPPIWNGTSQKLACSARKFRG